jgi:hypothetical protein
VGRRVIGRWIVIKCQRRGERNSRYLCCKSVYFNYERMIPVFMLYYHVINSQELYTLKQERKGCGTGRKKKKKPADLLPYQETTEANSTDETSPKKGGQNAGKFVKAKTGKFIKRKEEVRDRSGAVVEEGEALFQGFRVTKEDQKRLQALYRVGFCINKSGKFIKKKRRRGTGLVLSGGGGGTLPGVQGHQRGSETTTGSL